jgi:uncharacterized membrane protein
MLELLTILYSALPVTELRASIPLAISWGLDPIYVLFLAIIGNIIPVFIIIFGLDKITSLAEKYSPPLDKFLNWIFKRTRRKTSKQIKKYGNLALFLFVAIPLPMTGAWTGSIAAWLFGIPPKKAILPIIIGVITAGIIVTLISIGLFSYTAI